MGDYYKLNDEMTNTEFFQVIDNARKRNYSFNVVTEYSHLNIHSIEHQDLDLFEELSNIECERDAYKLIGFIHVNNIDIESVEVDHNLTFYKNQLWFNGSFEDLRIKVSQMYLNPEHWIGELIDP